MCGRYVITKPVEKTVKIVKSSTTVKDDENFNAHPSQALPIIKSYSNGKTLELVKWGIVPSWAKQKDFRPLINARIETIDEKVSFTIERIGGPKLIKKYRKSFLVNNYLENNNKIKTVIADHWKSLEKIKTNVKKICLIS